MLTHKASAFPSKYYSTTELKNSLPILKSFIFNNYLKIPQTHEKFYPFNSFGVRPDDLQASHYNLYQIQIIKKSASYLSPT
jgi:hypothetical protein